MQSFSLCPDDEAVQIGAALVGVQDGRKFTQVEKEVFTDIIVVFHNTMSLSKQEIKSQVQWGMDNICF